VPFATADEVVRIAVEAEQLGYHEVSGNDHLSTQRFVREDGVQNREFERRELETVILLVGHDHEDNLE